eukprot:732747-Hanusia_phi.AAC.2
MMGRRRGGGEGQQRAGALGKKKLQTFDWISIQLYESYSHANFAIYQKKEEPEKYFTEVTCHSSLLPPLSLPSPPSPLTLLSPAHESIRRRLDCRLLPRPS